MRWSLKHSLQFAFACTLISAQGAQARSWNPKGLNNPHGFNADWHPIQYTYKLHELLQFPKGAVGNDHIPWADSYWPKNRGGMAYRWKEFQQEKMNQELSVEDRRKLFFDVKRYPRSELRALRARNPVEYQRVIANLAPLEKYALYVNKPDREDYYNDGLLKEFIRSSHAQEEYWEGYCHAWAAVSSHYTEPMPVVRTTVDGLEIPFFTADVKALLVANYQQKTSADLGDALIRRLDKDKRAQVRFVGERCGQAYQYPVTKIKNGKEIFADYGDTSGLSEEQYLSEYVPRFQRDALRLKFVDPSYPALSLSPAEFVKETKRRMDSCENTNAGSFHIVLVNQLGRMKEGFLFDKTRDAEVWNQPAYRYSTEVRPYTDANGVEVTQLPSSAKGTVSVAHVKTKLYYADDSDYGWAFANPTLLGLFDVTGKLLDLSKAFQIEYQRYGELLMNEGDETQPIQYPYGVIDSAEYEYTLDLNAKGEIIGGDWISYDRPDYMWVMKKEPFFGEFSRLGELYEAVPFPMGQAPRVDL